MMRHRTKGFTLIELLVVIAIIGILASVVLGALNSARVKARDAKRVMETRQIVTALNLFYDQYGCLPITRSGGSSCIGAIGYAEQDSGSWDYSSQGAGFMTFLRTSGFMPTVPVDPVNNMSGNDGPAGTYAFRYYCYGDGDGGTLRGPKIEYWKEDGDWATSKVTVIAPVDMTTGSPYKCE